MNKTRPIAASFAAAAALIVIDQITKKIAKSALMGKDPYVLIPGVFEFEYVENKGMAFGMLQNKRIFFLVLTLIVCALLIYGIVRMKSGKLSSGKKSAPLRAAFSMLLGGAIGNFIDRLLNGYVVDFLSFCLIDFPVFNFADCCVTISAVLLIILLLFYYRDKDLKELFPDRKRNKKISTG